MQKTVQSGFSLIELLVVIAIIGILAAVGSTGYQSYISSTKVAVSKNNAIALASAITNADLAAQAGAAAYDDCAAGSTPLTCADAILGDAANSMKNPYDEATALTVTAECVTDGNLYVSGTEVGYCTGATEVKVTDLTVSSLTASGS